MGAHVQMTTRSSSTSVPTANHLVCPSGDILSQEIVHSCTKCTRGVGWQQIHPSESFFDNNLESLMDNRTRNYQDYSANISDITPLNTGSVTPIHLMEVSPTAMQHAVVTVPMGHGKATPQHLLHMHPE